MTSPSDGDPLQQPQTITPLPPLTVEKTRAASRDESPETGSTGIPIRTGSPPLAVSRSSTLTSVLSRSSSPNGRLSLSFARFGRSSIASPLGHNLEGHDDTRSLFVRAFSPTVAIYASEEAEDLAKRKGFKGLTELIRPYGERITGKVVVRDSTAASRAWDDFGVHFADLGRLADEAVAEPEGHGLEKLEELLEQFLENTSDDENSSEGGELSPYYKLFLSRILQSKQVSAHETFLHPVGCVIAISSASPQPIETLRNLYHQTAQGSRALPPYANPDYLRYYLLIHDDDRDDFAKSSALFDQMKRHFGLHCHLLRIRSAACTISDEDAEEHPPCEWMSTSENLAILQDEVNIIDLDESTSKFIFASDASAIRNFVRELVTQSIILHAEQRVSLWNEQVASRRRGISGRFMSLSKRWAGIGSSRSTSSSSSPTGTGASGNYDSIQGYYRHDTAEAILRKLADYAFMLRDYKLAASTYELLRSDYQNDKAWKYLAGANEMCCVAHLLNPLVGGSSSSKFKVENLDQMLETATYSYLTRCSEPVLALRTMLLGVELLKVRGRAASELAVKWAVRTLDLGLVGSIGHVLISERIAACLAGQVGVGNLGWGTRKRKAALWSIMSADEWMKLGRADYAGARMEEAQDLYSDLKHGDSTQQFKEMSEFMQQLQLAVRMKLGQARQRGLSNTGTQLLDEELVDETVEQLTTPEKLDGRANRRSLIGATGPLEVVVPLSPGRVRRDSIREDDDFE